MNGSPGLSKVSQTDAALVQLALAGDQSAYAELMARHRPRLERYAYFLLGNREDAEEVLQDTFLRGFRGLARFLEPSHVGTWMFRILVNRCRSRLARLDLIDRGAAAAAAFAAAPDHGEWERGEWREEIERALQQLTPDQREAFLLRYWEEMDVTETATIMGCSEGSVKTHCSRATHALAALLKDKGISL